MSGLPPWVPMYADAVHVVHLENQIPELQLYALIWQESNGGIHPGTGEWSPDHLYRFEPAYWDRYMRGKDEWAPPDGVPEEVWARRYAASYGIAQVMFGTAVWMGFPRDRPPEDLMSPLESLRFGARYLRHCLDQVDGDWQAACLKYNGGGRPAYADEVAHKVALLEGAGLGFEIA